MRHIPKPHNSPARSLIESERQNMRDAGVTENYNQFRKKEELNAILRGEQKFICCYCQQRISNYRDNKKGSHNEHFYPQRDISQQLSYENIYACCNRTKGQVKRNQHCGEHKGEDKIQTRFLALKDCTDYFKYTVNGEILPQCPYGNLEDVIANKSKLTHKQLEALAAIEILNLNAGILKNLRRKVIDILFKSSINKTYQQLDTQRQKISTEQVEYIEFIDTILYFLHKMINKKRSYISQ